MGRPWKEKERKKERKREKMHGKSPIRHREHIIMKKL